MIWKDFWPTLPLLRVRGADTVMSRGYKPLLPWRQNMALMPSPLHCCTVDFNDTTKSGNWGSKPHWNTAYNFTTRISGLDGRKESGFQRSLVFIVSNTAAASTAKRIVICQRTNHYERLGTSTDHPGTYFCNYRNHHLHRPSHPLDGQITW